MAEMLESLLETGAARLYSCLRRWRTERRRRYLRNAIYFETSSEQNTRTKKRITRLLKQKKNMVAEDAFIVTGMHVNASNLVYEAAVLRAFFNNKTDRFTFLECTRILALYEHTLIAEFVKSMGSRKEPIDALAFSGLYKIRYKSGYIRTRYDEWDDEEILEECSGIKLVEGSSLSFCVNGIGKELARILSEVDV
ncbi:hypothetical protein [Adlercreutzia caecimuris]|uniref:hypothetical protein n=1 Tax=Adlercreutzia caecimuris TaxID=671266 RepID=UPI00272BECF9|nr:hypothetical protein [Adlercreutzia caecimuris]